MTLKIQKVKKKVGLMKNQQIMKEILETKMIKNKKKRCCLRTHPLIVALTQGEFLKDQHQCSQSFEGHNFKIIRECSYQEMG